MVSGRDSITLPQRANKQRRKSTRQRYWSKSRKHVLSARRRYWPAPCGPLILTSIRGDASPLTPGTPLVRSGSEGPFFTGRRGKTNPEGRQAARIGICAERIRQPSIEASVTALLETQRAAWRNST